MSLQFITHLPRELSTLILQYIPQDHLLDILNLDPELDSIILHYLFPVTYIDYIDPHLHKHYIVDCKGVLYEKGKIIFKNINLFIKFCCKFKYIPNRIIFQDVCDFLQLHFEFGDVLRMVDKIEIRTELSRDLASLCRNVNQVLMLGYDNLYCIRLSREITWNELYLPNIKQMEVYFDQDLDYSMIPIPSNVETLQVHGIKLENVIQLPGDLRHLEILSLANYQFTTQTISFPLQLTHLTLYEYPLVLNSIDISYLEYLVRFDYHGSLHTNEIISLTQLNLPISLKSLELTSLKLENLYSLNKYINLEILKIVDCPVFHHFFTDTIFPPSLKSIIYGPNQCVHINQVFARKAIEYPQQYHNNSYFIVDDKFILPPYLKSLHLENLPFVRIIASKLILPQSLNQLIFRNMGGFIDKSSNLKLSQNLYSLTLRDLSIEFINDLKFPDKLYHLNLSKNFLTSIEGTNLSNLKYLQEINLSYNKFTTTSSFVNNLPTKLTRLNLHGNKLNKCILNDISLQSLELEFSSQEYIVGNGIFKLPCNIKTLQLWANSNLKFDKFIEFPNSLTNFEIHQWKSSRIILNNGNFFNKLPEKLISLKLYDVVIIEENHIQFPINLQHLTISCSFTQDLIDRIDISKCTQLKSINFTGGHVQTFNLDKIPEHIERIELQNMGLYQILGSFSKFPRLKHINLEKNHLSKSLQLLTLPNSLFTLILNKNDLDNLSITIDNCHRLKFVFLERNPKLEQCVLQLMSLAEKLCDISHEFGAIYLSSPTKIINSKVFQEKFDYFDKIIKDADRL